jgi:hypothetical protein
MKRAALLLLALVACRRSDPPVTWSAGDLRISMPSRADERVTLVHGPAVLELEALGVGDGRAEWGADRSVVYRHKSTRITHVATVGRIEELRRVEERAAPLSYRVTLKGTLTSLRVVDDIVEALDARGVAWLRTEPAYLTDARGARRDLHPVVQHAGATWSLTWAIDDTGLVYPLDIDPAWTVTTALAQARRDNAMHALSTGKVLTLGGLSPTARELSSVEAWDPTTKTWTSAGVLKHPRTTFASVLLPSGKILAAGGSGTGAATTVEIYDPTTSTSTDVATSLEDIGIFPRSAVLSSTSVLIVSSGGGSQHLDLTTGTLTPIAYNVERDWPNIAVLASGKVLLAGGVSSTTFEPISDAEIYDPATKKWSVVASMKKKRGKPESVTLLTGKVLVAGGGGDDTSAELYDPIADTWTLTPPMTGGHSFCSMLLLTNGKALIVGGDIAAGLSDRADLYDPVANQWSFAGKIIAPLDEYGAVPLPGGRALIAGGSNGAPVSTTQIFDPQANGKSCLGPGECTSGFCVDGACCEKASCAMGQTCGGSGAPGACLSKDGAACTKDSECGSAHCVDGLCCDTACTDQCGACNLKGSEGKCVAVPAGDAPHAPRTECAGDGVCRARCGGIDKTKCTQFPGTPVICAEPKCEAGQETRARGCDGAGACATVTPKSCGSYVCGANACKVECAEDRDCIEGNTCDLVTRKCVIAATCENEQTVKSPDGATKSCVPFKCAAGRCVDSCKDTSACAAGFVCDVNTTRCVPGAVTEPGDDGGCSYGRSTSDGWLLLALLALKITSIGRTRGRKSDRLR